MKHPLLAQWQGNFLTGLAIVFPAVISMAVLVWLFGTVANITDTLLIFLPRRLTHHTNGDGPMHWYWSLSALALALLLISMVGLGARNYLGKQLITWMDQAILRVPLLNKIYAACKQVNDAFSTSKKTAFRTVVMVEFPHPGAHSIGFVTNDDPELVQAATGRKVWCVFIPTTPNPTSGFLILLPPEKVTRLNMSVSDAIKYIISLGSVTPDTHTHNMLAVAQKASP